MPAAENNITRIQSLLCTDVTYSHHVVIVSRLERKVESSLSLLISCGYMYLEVGSTIAKTWVVLHLVLVEVVRKQEGHMESLGGNSFMSAFG